MRKKNQIKHKTVVEATSIEKKKSNLNIFRVNEKLNPSLMFSNTMKMKKKT